MRISISNIAWEPDQDEAVAAVLRGAGIQAVDLAPGKYLPDILGASDEAIAEVRQRWADRGFRIEGMQSLLFGSTGLNLFGDDGTMLDRLAAVCRIGEGLGARALTFGSPRQRDRGDRSFEQARDEAVDFFRRIGDIAADRGVLFCLEPNPAVYGCNFMTTAAETAEVVEATDHPAVRMQLDVGALALNGEDAPSTIAHYAALIGHVHASEPQLVPLGRAGSDHRGAASALAETRPELTVTIEMLSPKDENAPAVVAEAVDVAVSAYGAA